MIGLSHEVELILNRMALGWRISRVLLPLLAIYAWSKRTGTRSLSILVFDLFIQFPFRGITPVAFGVVGKTLYDLHQQKRLEQKRYPLVAVALTLQKGLLAAWLAVEVLFYVYYRFKKVQLSLRSPV